MDIWEFYDKVNLLVKKWESEGLIEFSSRLKAAKASGCTSGEILGEIGLVLKEFKLLKKNGYGCLDVDLVLDFIEKSLD